MGQPPHQLPRLGTLTLSPVIHTPEPPTTWVAGNSLLTVIWPQKRVLGTCMARSSNSSSSTLATCHTHPIPLLCILHICSSMVVESPTRGVVMKGTRGECGLGMCLARRCSTKLHGCLPVMQGVAATVQGPMVAMVAACCLRSSNRSPTLGVRGRVHCPCLNSLHLSNNLSRNIISSTMDTIMGQLRTTIPTHNITPITIHTLISTSMGVLVEGALAAEGQDHSVGLAPTPCTIMVVIDPLRIWGQIPVLTSPQRHIASSRMVHSLHWTQIVRERVVTLVPPS